MESNATPSTVTFARPRATCESGGSSSIGASTGYYDCSASFEACSDGHYYEVLCQGPPGAVDCYCSIDGDHVDQNRSLAGICPFLHDPDEGVIATNYVCGFRIVPINEE